MQWFRLLPFGLYLNKRSFLHDADPRSKLIFAATYLSLVTSSNDLLSMFCYGIAAFLLIFVSRWPFNYLWNGLKGVIPLLLALALYHLMLNDFKNATLVPCKLMLFILTASSLSITTTPVELAAGLEAILSPLRFVRFPVQHFVFMFTVAIRFIPLFIDETESILKSQKVRNAHFKGGYWIKIRSLPQLLFALIVSAFRRADQLALAMDARCYLPDNGIRASRLRFGWRDWVIVSFTLVLLLLCFWLNDTAVEW
ncbi:energy-coupling factor transporter transmembrane component T family protein [Paenibacillus sp. GCM10027626]|uniref:energy-coupling factor transporter transmembrane component T family protein n=1 Tax=Paenibacillus sp. GCM10027626 TaxID=3273411 RepID=UPI003633B616